jgi:hypothetical protein
MSDTANIHIYTNAEPLAVDVIDNARHVVAGACQSPMDCRLLLDALDLLPSGDPNP